MIPETQHPDDLQEIAFTHAAMTRLAALISQRVSPAELFAAVTREVRRRFKPTTVRMIRYESDGTATVMANEGTVGPHVRVGEQWRDFPAAGLTTPSGPRGGPRGSTIIETCPGAIRTCRRASECGGSAHLRRWDPLGSDRDRVRIRTLSPDTEKRLTTFTGLTAIAIATAQCRAEVTASRARIVTASDECRRRIERDLHDGAQQHLVNVAMRLAMLSECSATSDRMRADLQEASELLLSAMDELREIARGIYPAVLSQAGLGPRCAPWLGDRQCLRRSESMSIRGCLPRLKWPPTTWSARC